MAGTQEGWGEVLCGWGGDGDKFLDAGDGDELSFSCHSLWHTTAV